jgi:hypothetical protein
VRQRLHVCTHRERLIAEAVRDVFPVDELLGKHVSDIPLYLNFVVYSDGSKKWWWVLNRKSLGTLPPECLAHSTANYPTESHARNEVLRILANMPQATINGETR